MKRKVIVFIVTVLFYAIPVYAEVYTFILRGGFFLQIRTKEGISLQYLLENPDHYFALFLLTTNSYSESINDLGFDFYGLSNHQPSLIETPLEFFSYFLSILSQQNPVLLVENTLSFLNYESVTQVNYLAINFSEILSHTNSINPLPVLQDNIGSGEFDPTQYHDYSCHSSTNGFDIALQTHSSLAPVAVTNYHGPLYPILCKYGCKCILKTRGMANHHYKISHENERKRIDYFLSLKVKCPFCGEKKFSGFHGFTQHMRRTHPDFSYKDLLDRME